jgi:hypothetical protein
MIVLLALALYAATGIAIATTFLVFGVTRVLAKPVPVTLGARIMLFPGTAALFCTDVHAMVGHSGLCRHRRYGVCAGDWLRCLCVADPSPH